MLFCISIGWANSSKLHSVGIGVGNHYGGYDGGVAYSLRWNEKWGAMVGAGTDGIGIGGRYYPLVESTGENRFYVQAGFSPTYWNEYIGSVYGPDAAVGWELNRKVFHFNAAVGVTYVEVLFIDEMLFLLDLGIGINFGKRDPQD